MKPLTFPPLLVLLMVALVIATFGALTNITPASSAATDDASRSLSVYGVGTATGTPEAVTLQFIIEYWDDWGRGPSQTTAEKLEPIVDAALSVGIDESAITIPSGFSGYGAMYRMEIQFDTPDREVIQDLFEEIEEATRFEDMVVVHVGGYFEVEDCSSLESEAFAAAIEDARQRSGLLGSALELNVREVTNGSDESRVTMRGHQQSTSCEAPAGFSSMEGPLWMMSDNYSAFDPDAELEVQLVRVVNVTYAVE